MLFNQWTNDTNVGFLWMNWMDGTKQLMYDINAWIDRILYKNNLNKRINVWY